MVLLCLMPCSTYFFLLSSVTCYYLLLLPPPSPSIHSPLYLSSFFSFCSFMLLPPFHTAPPSRPPPRSRVVFDNAQLLGELPYSLSVEVALHSCSHLLKKVGAARIVHGWPHSRGRAGAGAGQGRGRVCGP